MRIDGGGAAAAKCFPTGWSSTAAKPCNTCETAAALLFCRTHASFMCVACDAKVHVGVSSRHERVWMCEVCEQAPAVVTCKADAAALCVTCDHDIHSANPLARRHDRVPAVPFYDKAEAFVKSTAAAFLIPAADTEKIGPCVAHEESPAATTVNIPHKQQPSIHEKSIELLFSDPDQFLDFDYPIEAGTDSVVPVQTTKAVPAPAPMMDHSPDNCFEIDFSRSSSFNSFNNSSYTTQSFSQSVSSSSMDVGVVPDGNSMSDISYPFALQMSAGIDLSGSTNNVTSQAPQLSGMDREARVKRYREKRKNRKFEKTIRYASRKAYAETRPRIKGRFAKRTETEMDADCLFTSGSTPAFLLGDSRFGVVPSF